MDLNNNRSEYISVKPQRLKSGSQNTKIKQMIDEENKNESFNNSFNFKNESIHSDTKKINYDEESEGYVNFEDMYPNMEIPSAVKIGLSKTDDTIRCKMISHGGFGEVLKAHTLKNVKYNVAIKVNFYRGENYINYIIGEKIYAEKNISSPYLAKSIYCSDDCKIITMKYYGDSKNNSLSAMLELEKANKCPPINRKKAIMDILLAIQELHKNNILHNDIKPSNVICENISSQEQKFILCDFGSAQDISKNTEHALSGTRLYKSPERTNCIMIDEYKADKHSDIWSAGILILELVSPNLKELKKDLSMAIEIIKSKKNKSDTFDDVQKYIYTIIDKNTNNQYKQYNSILKNMLRIMPEERLSIDYYIDSIKSIEKTKNNSISI